MKFIHYKTFYNYKVFENKEFEALKYYIILTKRNTDYAITTIKYSEEIVLLRYSPTLKLNIIIMTIIVSYIGNVSINKRSNINCRKTN